MSVAIDGKLFVPVELSYTEPNGDSTHYQFSDFKVNKPIPADPLRARPAFRRRRPRDRDPGTVSTAGPSPVGAGGATFELLARDGSARRGRLTTAHGVVETPCFMPVGTLGAVKGLGPTAARRGGRLR